MAERPDLEAMPLEVVRMITKQLDIPALKSLRQVNHRMYDNTIQECGDRFTVRTNISSHSLQSVKYRLSRSKLAKHIKRIKINVYENDNSRREGHLDHQYYWRRNGGVLDPWGAMSNLLKEVFVDMMSEANFWEITHIQHLLGFGWSPNTTGNALGNTFVRPEEVIPLLLDSIIHLRLTVRRLDIGFVAWPNDNRSWAHARHQTNPNIRDAWARVEAFTIYYYDYSNRSPNRQEPAEFTMSWKGYSVPHNQPRVLRIENMPRDPVTQNPFLVHNVPPGTTEVTSMIETMASEESFACMEQINLKSVELYWSALYDLAFHSSGSLRSLELHNVMWFQSGSVNEYGQSSTLFGWRKLLQNLGASLVGLQSIKLEFLFQRTDDTDVLAPRHEAIGYHYPKEAIPGFTQILSNPDDFHASLQITSTSPGTYEGVKVWKLEVPKRNALGQEEGALIYNIPEIVGITYSGEKMADAINLIVASMASIAVKYDRDTEEVDVSW